MQNECCSWYFLMIDMFDIKYYKFIYFCGCHIKWRKKRIFIISWTIICQSACMPIEYVYFCWKIRLPLTFTDKIHKIGIAQWTINSHLFMNLVDNHTTSSYFYDAIILYSYQTVSFCLCIHHCYTRRQHQQPSRQKTGM